MRHRKSFNHLGRQRGHRKAMLANMASSLILHKRIETTTAKAKALRTYVEPLITKTKNLSTVEEKTHAQRVVFSYLQDKLAVKELFGEVAEKVENRPGGYTRILKLGARLGDNADMCIIELVDYNENMLSDKEEKKTSTRRRRRGGSSKASATQTETATDTATEVAEEPAAKASAEETVVEATTEEATAAPEASEEVKEEEKKEDDSEKTKE
jgi:large subunit ribosomal protein L17